MTRLPPRLTRARAGLLPAVVLGLSIGFSVSVSVGVRPGGAAWAQDAEPRFFTQLDDLPLMAGLHEIEEANLAFDKPGGRIGEVYAEGGVPAEKVRAFYGKTLPQFGWKPAGENRFTRDGEQLEVEVTEAGGTTTLRISLSPTD